jgi:hypothetical protein
MLVARLAASAKAFGLFAPSALVLAHDPACSPAVSEATLRPLAGRGRGCCWGCCAASIRAESHAL